MKNKYKLGIFGSAEENNPNFINKAKELGRELTKFKDKIIIFTGACSGLPYTVAYEAAGGGVEVWGFSPAKDLEDQKKETPNDDLSIYKKFIFLPENFAFINNINISRKYRNVILTASSDAGIIVGGRFGTLNEFTCLYDMNKIIGVYQGSGGAADEIFYLINKIHKNTEATVFFSPKPAKLIEQIIKKLEAS
ncbi:MAG: hypothetical protein N2482_03155 [Patescibacteria group bacterium]|nr:hypothetical protein [Patescibacteria group bacterium]